MTADDLAGAWLLDFHHPRGIVPLALRLLDHLVAGSQQAAAETGSGSGFTARLVGTHVYYGAAPTPTPPPYHGAAPAPAASGAGSRPWSQDPELVRRYAQGFPDRWAGDAAALEARLRELEAVTPAELAAAGRDRSGGYLRTALDVHQQAWRLHFATMYRLLAVHAQPRSSLAALGLDEVTVAGLLQGEDNAVLAADAELRELARLARELGVAADLETPARSGEVAEDGPVALWWKAFGEFLDRHGHRGEAGAELAVPPWDEDPLPVLALIAAESREQPTPHRRATRDELTERVSRGLAPSARDQFDAALGLARRANFVWWNEEHNALIDLRAHLPVRRAALAAGAALGLRRRDDPLYLQVPELQALLAGELCWPDLAASAQGRREYVTRWRSGRAALPVRLGSGAGPGDPVLREILGVQSSQLVAGAAILTGLGVSPGVGRGRARVLATARELAQIRPGEVLVCEATSPAWTPVFDRIAACVCDQGGMLTHAAIIAREYGVPTVCAVADATGSIRTGDLVEVDGRAGLVRLLDRLDRLDRRE